MHSPCTLACPTLSFWSCIQVHGLGLRTQTRGFKEAARNQKPKKTKIWERIFWFRLGFWFLWIYSVFFGFWVEKPQKKNTCVFLVFAVSRSPNRAKKLAIFWFFTQKPKKTCVFLVFAVSRSLNRANTLAIFGFSLQGQKNMRAVGFSATSNIHLTFASILI